MIRLQPDEVQAIAAFIWQSALTGPALPKQTPGNAMHGKELLESRGCLGCHSVGEGSNTMGGTFAANLSRVGEKDNYDYLVRWVHNPRERMRPYSPFEKRDLGPGHRPRRVRQLVERTAERRTLCGGRDGPGKRCERLDRDAGGACENVLFSPGDHGHNPSRSIAAAVRAVQFARGPARAQRAGDPRLRGRPSARSVRDRASLTLSPCTVPGPRAPPQYRFYIVMLVLMAIAVAFVVGSWHEIQRLFGL